MFCREQFARVAARSDAFDAAGVDLIAIGSGTPPFAQDFIEQMRAGGHGELDVFVDPDRRSYLAFDMKRGALDLLKPRVWKASRRAMAAGHRQGLVRGDALQNGGAVVVDTAGRVRFAHVEEHAGDLVDVDALLNAAQAAGG